MSNIDPGTEGVTVYCMKKLQEPVGGLRAALYYVPIDYNLVESKSVIANIYRHWKSDDFSFSSYVGTRIGATKMKIFRKASVELAYQLKVGINYCINKHINICIRYRCFSAVVNNLKFETALFEKDKKEKAN
ncbi:P44/Msp2 family outer membrane protein [Wolbachia endosymbiont of Brugia malayi]|uniref:P44/Msp2 family outer membrane protein n=2 Tax=Wolbachia endosymbiont of Brugia malayi TaxID=80849 RepID=UPI0002E0CBA6|nr:P44/Msp2 family outer membrane protein [Wolbachia endosymbiont of Brugia malayi]QCB61717.1 P44/Msp2 family outer membrane protein [Wolbachia endosymbiont of Brugia malayi]